MLAETLNTWSCYELGEYDAMKVHLEREMQLSRQLGARRFEAQGLEMQARMLLDTGRAAEAAQMLREALAMCRDVGMQFTGPKTHSALSRAVDDKAEHKTGCSRRAKSCCVAAQSAIIICGSTEMRSRRC